MPKTFVLSFVTFILGLGLGTWAQNARVERHKGWHEKAASELCNHYIRAVQRGDGYWRKDEKGRSHFEWSKQYGNHFTVPECE